MKQPNDFGQARGTQEEEALRMKLRPALAQLRHAYWNLTHAHDGWPTVMSVAHQLEFAEGLIAPQIRRLEELAELLSVEDAGSSDARRERVNDQRKAQPEEDDNLVSRIEIEFAIPTFLPQGFMQDLDALLSAAVKMKRNQPEGGVHWVSGHGSKPIWSQADAMFLGKSVADDAKAAGEPTFDDSIYHIETSARPYVTEEERARYEKSAPSPPIMVDRDADIRRELRAYLDGLLITSDNIGDIRRSLFMPWASPWNGWVRDETAERENKQTSSPPPTGSATAGLIEKIIQEVAELPDRTSPDDWPEAMLVTADELRAILLTPLAASQARHVELKALPPEWADAANSARGLCESEANRWETASPSTAAHWRSVSVRLGALYLTQDSVTASQARAQKKEDVLSRTGELAVDPLPQHASPDLKG